MNTTNITHAASISTPETLQAMPAPRNAFRGVPPVATLYGPEPMGAAGLIALADVFHADTAARLVACWNAWSGIPTEDLQRMPAGYFDHLAFLAQALGALGAVRQLPAGHGVAEGAIDFDLTKPGHAMRFGTALLEWASHERNKNRAC